MSDEVIAEKPVVGKSVIQLFPSEKDMKNDDFKKCFVQIRPDLEQVMTRIMRETTLIRISDLRKIAKILEKEIEEK